MTFPKRSTYWQWVCGFILFEACSWFAYIGSTSEMVAIILLMAALLIIAWKRPLWLAYVSIAELMVGGKGYLFFLDVGGLHLSIRMLIFILILLVTIRNIRNHWSQAHHTVVPRALRYLVGWLLISICIALIRKVSWSSIYSDVNAFFYLSMLPAWWILVRNDPYWRPRIFAIVLAGASIIGLKSWLMVGLFSHDVSNIRQIYLWIRNTGIGEITFITENTYRIFFQSQIYSLLVLCGMVGVFTYQRIPRWFFVPMALSAVGVYISLSRSFWLSGFVTLSIFCLYLMIHRKWKVITRFLVILPLALFSWAMMVWALSFPAFTLSGGRANTVSMRLNGVDSASATSSRSNQIRPLLQNIKYHPVIGNGFGSTVTYFSTDPRTKGWRTTSAFELGYLDLWLKIGLVGLFLYAAWIYGLFRKIRHSTWGTFFIVSGTALLIVHLTTPYLNHPLGLGWLMLTSLFAYDQE